MHSVYSEKFDKIGTFEKLAKQNVKFYYGPRLMEEHIDELLKLEMVHYHLRMYFFIFPLFLEKKTRKGFSNCIPNESY